MKIINRLREAEEDGLTVTLDPSELTELNEEIKCWLGMYVAATKQRDRVRLAALEGRDALRGYDHRSPVAERITRVCRGES